MLCKEKCYIQLLECHQPLVLPHRKQGRNDKYILHVDILHVDVKSTVPHQIG